MDQSRIEPITFCLLRLCFSALHHRSQLAFTEICTHVIDSLALGVEVTLRVLDCTKYFTYKYQHTEEISYTKALPLNGSFPKCYYLPPK